MEQGDVYTDL